MPSREISEIFHIGWPDPDWIKGFSVIIRPLVAIDPAAVQDVMTTEEVPGLEPLLARNTFDSTQVCQAPGQSELIVLRDRLHCGTPGSQMHHNALASINFRLDMLLDK